MWSLPLFPPAASTMASKVDTDYFFLLAVSAFFVILIASLIIVFGVRYRRRAHSDVGAKVIPALYFCKGIVDVVTVDRVL
jgi:heme/copper-type cytochrome/quinol oxidase subunit 2